MHTLTVNGTSHHVEVDDDTPLLWVIRDASGLTGTKFGCGLAQCGACTVHVNGTPIKSCTMFAVQLNGADIKTIEGVGADGALHPMQAAFREEHGLQCGFCTPGMVMMGLDIASRHKNPSDAVIRHELEGNLCRCTGYHNIVKAIAAGAKAMAG